MQAIILAAGMGKRLKALTRDNTKCMVKVNGVSLIDRMLHQLDMKHLNRIVIVVGYEGKKLIDYISTLNIDTPIIYIENPIYDKTNNIYSLALAKEELLRDDTLLFESDIIFEDAVIDGLIEDSRETLALVDKYESWMDGTCVKLNKSDDIVDFISGKKLDYTNTTDYYKTVNIYKFSKHFSESRYVPFLEAYQSALGENEYYEQVLRVVAMLDEPEIKAKRLNGERWYEIDDIQDLDIAESIFAPDDEQHLSLLQSRYGGFWRYPKLLDFCYLVNPFFPNARMKAEMRASFDVLLTEYPSGMRVNSLVAARNFGVNTDNIVTGNGAAELIKSLMDSVNGVVGFVRPTFEEYPNRYDSQKSVYYYPDNNNFSYSADDLIDFFTANPVQYLVVVNPDNPSGNYIPKKDILNLADWCRLNEITLILDESFVDFADEPNSSIIDQQILEEYSNLIVLKSISKSYGVPGLRLGVMASGNTDLIRRIKKDVSIWNINSFAEFFMQIEEKYKKDYEKSLVQIKAERRRFEHRLSAFRDIRVIPSQANYILVELCSSISAFELTKVLLNKYNILIKDLSSKTNGKDYIRIAVRNKEDNDELLKALANIIN